MPSCLSQLQRTRPHLCDSFVAAVLLPLLKFAGLLYASQVGYPCIEGWIEQQRDIDSSRILKRQESRFMLVGLLTSDQRSTWKRSRVMHGQLRSAHVQSVRRRYICCTGHRQCTYTTSIACAWCAHCACTMNLECAHSLYDHTVLGKPFTHTHTVCEKGVCQNMLQVPSFLCFGDARTQCL